MPDRRLVVTEADPNDGDFGKMFAVAPNVATGIPIPAFKFGAVLPTVGTLVGEAFYEISSRKGWVWTGSAWREIAANPLRTFATDQLLLADTAEPTGTYAISTATGNLFVKRPTGWHFVGVQEFANVTQLLAAAPTTGALAVALDEDSLWIMTSTGWRSLSVRHFADTTALLAWDNPPGTAAGANPAAVHTGDQAVADDVEVMYSRTANGWVPVSIYSDTEAKIRAATWPIAGQEAISIDTGRTFSFTGTSWVEEPIQHFATEVALLATTPQNGVLAWADDTAMAFTRSGGTWHRLGGGITSTVSPTAPSDSASVAGDLWINSAGGTNELKIFDGTKFISTTGSSLYQNNARVVLPGYFNKVPSATVSNDDEGGIAFQYYGSHYRLFLNKSTTWHPVSPWVGDANNANKVCIADADGCPTWGGYNPPAVKWIDSTTNGGTADWSQDLPNPQRYIKWNVSGASSANTRLMMIMEQNSNWWDWSSHLPEAQAMTSYESNGIREELAAIKSDWWTSTSGGKITDNDSSYGIKANTTWHCVGHILLATDRATFMADTSYTSDNGTPMRCIFRARWDQDMRQCNKFGFKFAQGTGWFLGHVEYQ